MQFHLRRNPNELTARTSLPPALYNVDNLSRMLQAGYRLFSSGRLAAISVQFKTVLHAALFTVASDQKEADEVALLIDICREYITGVALEQERRSITASAASDPKQQKRALELAAYFTHCQLQSAHLQVALRQATKQAFRFRNFSTASQFARRLLELAPAAAIAEEVLGGGEGNERELDGSSETKSQFASLLDKENPSSMRTKHG